MDCPRCASDNSDGDRFCWLCGWDFTKESEICEQCGNEVKKNENCVVCRDPTAGWGDWNPFNPFDEDDE